MIINLVNMYVLLKKDDRNCLVGKYNGCNFNWWSWMDLILYFYLRPEIYILISNG